MTTTASPLPLRLTPAFGVFALAALKALELYRALRTTADVSTSAPAPTEPSTTGELPAGRVDFEHGQTGVTFDDVVIPWLRGAQRIVITDPWIHRAHQLRNLRELIASIAATHPERRIRIELVTSRYGTDAEHQRQRDGLHAVQRYAEAADIDLVVCYQDQREMHLRDIVTDNGWRITLDRGLDMWDRATGPAADRQELRTVKRMYVVYERT